MILIFREQQAVKVPTPTETTENSICFSNSENKNLLDKENKGLIKSIDDEIYYLSRYDTSIIVYYCY